MSDGKIIKLKYLISTLNHAQLLWIGLLPDFAVKIPESHNRNKITSTAMRTQTIHTY